ncbi:hypothetical protein [Brevibacillus borstelensis]|uniref:hypothetical protein n=1 Tax=Brevibacillus borstelensis TaxID=45462 RepID=UPI002042531B|nr:hypothetical protein [Brevibacillus borstelensis]MCM3471023.1 hypothetical protein [Brevibacillus borstelensis]
MDGIIKKFTNLLSERFNYNDLHTTEDTVRYTFFASLLANEYIKPHEIILEFPHPGIPNKEVDTYIPSIGGRKGIIAEFKYDRSTSSSTNSPRTMKAGKLLNDLFRLSLFNIDQHARKWLIYLTDEEMDGYFSNAKNGLTDFYNLPFNEMLTIDEDYIGKKANTFRKAINMNGINGIEIKCLCSNGLPKRHRLKIYEVTKVVSKYDDPSDSTTFTDRGIYPSIAEV